MPARGKPFEPGNTFGRGRPRGSRNKTNLLAQELLDSFAEALTRKNISMALQGEPGAMRQCFDRVLPLRRDSPVRLASLPVGTLEELNKASEILTKRALGGRLALSDATRLAQLIEWRRQEIETLDVDQRLRALEAKQ